MLHCYRGVYVRVCWRLLLFVVDEIPSRLFHWMWFWKTSRKRQRVIVVSQTGIQVFSRLLTLHRLEGLLSTPKVCSSKGRTFSMTWIWTSAVDTFEAGIIHFVNLCHHSSSGASMDWFDAWYMVDLYWTGRILALWTVWICVVEEFRPSAFKQTPRYRQKTSAKLQFRSRPRMQTLSLRHSEMCFTSNCHNCLNDKLTMLWFSRVHPNKLLTQLVGMDQIMVQNVISFSFPLCLWRQSWWALYCQLTRSVP